MNIHKPAPRGFSPVNMLVTAVFATGVCAAGNFFIPVVLSVSIRTELRLAFAIAWFFSGMLLGEIVLLATWAALGQGRPVTRIPLALCVFVLLMACFLASLRLLGETFDGLMVMATVQLASFVLMQAPLWSLRGIWGHHLARPGARTQSQLSERAQFGLIQLLGFTALVAVTLGVVRFAIPQDEFDLGEFPDATVLGAMLLFFSMICLSTGSVALPAIWLVMATHRRILAGIVLLNSLTIVPVALTIFYALLQGAPMTHLLFNIFCLVSFGAGVLTMTCGGLLVLRYFGYRLISPVEVERIAAEAQPDLASS